MQDPLNISIPLANIDVTLPLLPEGNYLYQIKESVIEPNKDKNGYNWNLKVSLVDSAVGVDGREVKPGTSVYVAIALQPRADSKDPEAYLRGISETVDAIFGSTKENRPNLTSALVSEALGKTVIGNTYIDEYQGRKSNKIRRFVSPNAAPETNGSGTL